MRRSPLDLVKETASPGAARCCEHPGCAAAAEHRAPRTRANLNEFYWFCLEHVRAYNAAWNYYAGLNEREIEAELRNDAVWQRPTWPLGARVGTLYGARIKGFGLFDLDEGPDAEKQEAPKRRPLTPQEEALSVFELAPPFTVAGLKTRYKQLVKLHHPDAHGGDKAAEEKLKIINRAYSTLKAAYFP